MLTISPAAVSEIQLVPLVNINITLQVRTYVHKYSYSFNFILISATVFVAYS